MALSVAMPGLARCAVSVSPISQCARRPPPVFTILLQGLSRSTAGAGTSTPTGDPASCARYAQQVFCHRQRLSYTFGKMDLFHAFRPQHNPAESPVVRTVPVFSAGHSGHHEWRCDCGRSPEDLQQPSWAEQSGVTHFCCKLDCRCDKTRALH